MAVTNVVNFTGYSQTGGGGSRGRGPADLDPQDEKDGFWELEKCVQGVHDLPRQQAAGNRGATDIAALSPRRAVDERADKDV